MHIHFSKQYPEANKHIISNIIYKAKHLSYEQMTLFFGLIVQNITWSPAIQFKGLDLFLHHGVTTYNDKMDQNTRQKHRYSPLTIQTLLLQAHIKTNSPYNCIKKMHLQPTVVTDSWRRRDKLI